MQNLQLDDEQSMIRETVQRLVQDVVAPRALEIDERRELARENFTALAELGILGLPVAEELGGAGMGMLAFAVALEDLGGACGSTARLLLCQTGQCASGLGSGGGERLRKLLDGQQLGAFVGREFSIAARRDGNSWILDGTAPAVTAAAAADVFVVAAASAEADGPGTDLVFCLDAAEVDRQAVEVLGFRSTAPGAVRFAGTRCGPDTLVAEGDDAARQLSAADLATRIGGGAMAVGAGQQACELSRRHADQRIAFGKPLTGQQAVRHKLAESEARIAAARHLVYHAARQADAGDPEAGRSAVQARLLATRAAVYGVDEAIQIHGGFGFTVEYHVERHYRDSVALQVLDGGEESLLDQL